MQEYQRLRPGKKDAKEVRDYPHAFDAAQMLMAALRGFFTNAQKRAIIAAPHECDCDG